MDSNRACLYRNGENPGPTLWAPFLQRSLLPNVTWRASQRKRSGDRRAWEWEFLTISVRYPSTRLNSELSLSSRVVPPARIRKARLSTKDRGEGKPRLKSKRVERPKCLGDWPGRIGMGRLENFSRLKQNHDEARRKSQHHTIYQSNIQHHPKLKVTTPRNSQKTKNKSVWLMPFVAKMIPKIPDGCPESIGSIFDPWQCLCVEK